MNDAFVAGAAMTAFGKHLERSSRDLVEEAVSAAFEDAGVGPEAIGACYVGNAVSGPVICREASTCSSVTSSRNCDRGFSAP